MSRENIEDIYELSPLQQGMVFHTITSPESSVYVEQLSCTLDGDLNLSAFQQAWQRVLERHSILRSAVHWEGLDKPYQVVSRRVDLPWATLDWRQLSGAEQQLQLPIFMERERRPIDLARPPLMRISIIRLDQNSFQFVWNFHHVLLDGWSVANVLKEVFEYYNALAQGRDLQLPPARPYRDFIRFLQQQNLRAAELFWRNALDQFSAPTALRRGRPYRKLNAQAGAFVRHGRDLGRGFTSKLDAFAREHKFTLNSIVQACWAIVLSRYSGENDVVWGTTVSGRAVELPGIDSMVGLFINTVPMRVLLGPNDRVVTWLNKFQQQQVELRQYDQTPLVQVQKWSDVPPALPLFESILVFENYLTDGSFPNLHGDVRIRNTRCTEESNYPLNVVAIPGESLRLEILYDDACFEALAIERMLGHMFEVLEGIVRQPEGRLGDLTLLGVDERLKLLTLWNATGEEYGRGGVVELFESQVEENLERLAVASSRGQLSYGELNERANQLAHYLKQRGVGPEVLVCVCMERSVEMVVGLLAVLKAGGAYVPLDPSYPEERLAFMLQDAAAPVLLTQQQLLSKLSKSTAEVICVDQAGAQLAGQSKENLKERVELSDLAYVIYTSGSTGKPKGVAIEQRGLLNLIHWHQRTYEVSAVDRATQLAAQAFDASVWELWPYLTAGASIHIPDEEVRSAPGELVKWLAEQRITLTFLATPLAEAVLEEDLPEGLSLKAMLTGGDRLHRAPQRDLPFRLMNHYGPTENTVVATYCEVRPKEEGAPPIGRPIANTQVYVLDEGMQPVPVGVAGELYIGGASLARGYHRRPELTAEKFLADRFGGGVGGRLYKTGDLVRYREDGMIEFLGRVDDQVKIRGFRIELGEIAVLLEQHPGVREAVVLATEKVPGEKRLVAYVVANEKQLPATAELVAWLKEKLPDYMVPANFVAIESIPVNANGKVDYISLQALPVESPIAKGHTSPLTQVERQIAEIWEGVLHATGIGVEDNFFDLGGHSLLLTQVHGRLQKVLGRPLPIVDLFKYPTISSLAARLNNGDSRTSIQKEKSAPAPTMRSREPIAITAMVGRFPGASSVEEFWNLLREGAEGITTFTDEEMIAAGVSTENLKRLNFVKAGTVLDGLELFDAGFFGFNAREAEITDPQHRLFLECAVQALEKAGCDPKSYSGLVGVFAGCAMSSYLYVNLLQQPGLLESLQPLQIMTAADKDFVPSRVSYKLNLTGPSVNVQTACSTSLVAVHMACQSLLSSECDVAIAGGIALQLPQRSGYFYHEEGVCSPDGHCRAFDAQAQGTVPGNGVGIVVLKRLSEAVGDGDNILAVIKGSAINNDGSQKIGYTAPSVEGQAKVIAAAQAMAGVRADTISYIEAHGTGTPLGDPIEIAALTQAFRATSEGRQYCALGSVKTNVGHLDAAAGITGLIKTVLQLKHKELVPSLHYERANPKIDFANSPFYVNTKLQEWKSKGERRRAGVSSFGIGGTNAHVVLEEAPEREESGGSRGWQVLTLSAKTGTALEAATKKLGEHLKGKRDEKLADVAYTQAVGRSGYKHRRVVVCESREEAEAALEVGAGQGVYTGLAEGERGVGFLFPGQGAQYVGMGRGLYEGEEVYRDEVDRCAERLRGKLGVDLREVLYAKEGGREGSGEELKQTWLTQPALFVVEWALAQMWRSWGVEPEGMAGHSVGEYVAATVAGVMEVEEALEVVAERGRLMQKVERGGMLSVGLEEEEVRGILSEGLWIGAVNGPGMTVVSGREERIEGFEKRLKERGIEGRRLETSHGFHSGMMDEVLEEFRGVMRGVRLKAPKKRYVSNVTGSWIREEEARDGEYWVRHLRETVRFGDNVKEMLSGGGVLLEVGPGNVLSGLARRQGGREVYGSLGSAQERGTDQERIARSLGRLWMSGVAVDWEGYYRGQKRHRLALPTYPFERQPYWIEPTVEKSVAVMANPTSAPEKKPDITDWFYLPSWKRSALSRIVSGTRMQGLHSIVFLDDLGVGRLVSKLLRQAGSNVVEVEAGQVFLRKSNSHYSIRPNSQSDYDALLSELASRSQTPQLICHLWMVTAGLSADGSLRERGFDSLLCLARALENHLHDRVQISLISNGLREVRGDENLCPDKALIIGPCKVIPQEYANIHCQSVDIELNERTTADELSNLIFQELLASPSESAVAWRGVHRWVETTEPVRLAKGDVTPVLREHGTYLITGGLSGIGLVIAEYLARTVGARLVLLGRSPIPSRTDWDNWIARHDQRNATSRRIRAIQKLEALGGEILAEGCDVTDADQVREILIRARQQFGEINGIIHSAGVAGAGIIQNKDASQIAQVFAPKLRGARILDELVTDSPLDFFVLCSSLSSVVGGPGQADYCAANAFLDAFARERTLRTGRPTVSINWDTWSETGMAVETQIHADLKKSREEDLKHGMASSEGVEVFCRILQSGLPQILVSTRDLPDLLRQATPEVVREAQSASNRQMPAAHSRPALSTEYIAPRNEVEGVVAGIWEELLGIHPVGVHDNFFDLGGHSLLAIQLLSRLRGTFQAQLTLRDVFEAGSVAQLTQNMVAQDLTPGRIEKISQVMVAVEKMSASDVCVGLQAEKTRSQQILSEH